MIFLNAIQTMASKYKQNFKENGAMIGSAELNREGGFDRPRENGLD